MSLTAISGGSQSNAIPKPNIMQRLRNLAGALHEHGHELTRLEAIMGGSPQPEVNPLEVPAGIEQMLTMIETQVSDQTRSICATIERF